MSFYSVISFDTSEDAFVRGQTKPMFFGDFAPYLAFHLAGSGGAKPDSGYAMLEAGKRTPLAVRSIIIKKIA